ncbi:uncharacterized protein SAPINGB_P004130 [Magnusiomyces paraingens]|uniref:Uncharacterized protein n=1 Tax=Magnusiomyces paraingens TaxID=2606893 RepID=A0A5E8BYB7_9ASCO|nr:uncharacterized protein SAPINGB_P004130 [Saprochaete ingens]VVT54547.1 unnamed protein product [Saprochaete ingens]
MAPKKRTNRQSQKSAGPSSRPRIPTWAAVVGPARIVKTPTRTYYVLTRRPVPPATLSMSNGGSSARPAQLQQQQQQQQYEQQLTGFGAQVEHLTDAGDGATTANVNPTPAVRAPQVATTIAAPERHGVVTPPPSPPFRGRPANIAGAMEWTMGAFGSTTRLVGYRTLSRRVSVSNRESARL